MVGNAQNANSPSISPYIQRTPMPELYIKLEETVIHIKDEPAECPALSPVNSTVCEFDYVSTVAPDTQITQGRRETREVNHPNGKTNLNCHNLDRKDGLGGSYAKNLSLNVNQVKDKSQKCSSNKNKTSEFNQDSNFNSFVGGDFLNRNSTLQSILKDIIVLSEEYINHDNNTLDEEIEKLRAQNNLPPLSALNSCIVDEESDSGDGLEDDSNGGDAKDSVSDTASQQSGSINDGEQLDDVDSEKLIIDESKMAEPEFVDVESYYSKENNEICYNKLQCPVCGVTFKSVDIFKRHFLICSSKDEAPKPKRGARSKSSQQPKSLSNSHGNLKIVQVFSAGEEVQKCVSSNCDFFGTKTDIQQHLKSVDHKPTTGCYICKECNQAFKGSTWLDLHYKNSGHSSDFKTESKRRKLRSDV